MKAKRLSLVIEVDGGDPMRLELGGGDVDIRTMSMSEDQVEIEPDARGWRRFKPGGVVDLILHVKGTRAKPAELLEHTAKCLHCGGWTCRRCKL